MAQDKDEITVFAPATIGNVGPGFDVLGLAVATPGDIVRARRVDESGARLIAVRRGDPQITTLPPCSNDNTACVAARAVLERLGVSWGVELQLEKGLPVGSGLGSSGASAVAAAVAINELAGRRLSRLEMLPACIAAEASACGAGHADNVAPALLGGFVLVRADGVAVPLETELALWVALVTPDQSLPTRKARAAIPAAIPRDEWVHNAGQLGTLIYALAKSDVELLRGAIDDRIAEPRRAHLIPGFLEAKRAALEADALGASIAGAGPTIFALCEDAPQAERVADAMAAALEQVGVDHRRRVSPVSSEGARLI